MLIPIYYNSISWGTLGGPVRFGNPNPYINPFSMFFSVSFSVIGVLSPMKPLNPKP